MGVEEGGIQEIIFPSGTGNVPEKQVKPWQKIDKREVKYLSTCGGCAEKGVKEK